MLDICLLGRGGTMPLPDRALTALLVRYRGRSLLIDCGEGTQVAIRRCGLSVNPIDTILFTHLHADHIAGLPGLLLTMGNQCRTLPVRLIGPAGLADCVSGLRVIARELPFELEVIELGGDAHEFTANGLRIEAFRVRHSVPCYGYALIADRPGVFDPARATAESIPHRFWRHLQQGGTIEADGRILTPNMVLGAPRKGLRVTYVTDTRPTEDVVAHAAGADLFICEGMYMDDAQAARAVETGHMTVREAAETARLAGANEMWLTHFGPAMPDPTEETLAPFREIFPNIVSPEDGRRITLIFEDRRWLKP